MKKPQSVEECNHPEHWPFHKIHANIQAKHNNDKNNEKAAPQLAVLVTTGALNPVHRGHFHMLESCAQQLEREHGFCVVGAFLSPSHDQYLMGKFRVKRCAPPHVFAATDRVKFCAAMAADHALIDVGAWESDWKVKKHWPDFPDVCENLRDTLAEAFPQPQQNDEEAGQKDRVGGGRTKKGRNGRILVIYCCGEDHQRKCNLRGAMCGGTVGICVVSRDKRTPRTDPAKLLFGVHEDHSVDRGLTNDFSSTKVRELLERLVSSSTFKAIAAANNKLRAGDDDDGVVDDQGVNVLLESVDKGGEEFAVIVKDLSHMLCANVKGLVLRSLLKEQREGGCFKR